MNKKLLFVPLFMIIFVILLIPLTLLILNVNDKISRYKVINSFKKNENLFNNSLNELLSTNGIGFFKEQTGLIKIYYHDERRIITFDPEEDNMDEYKQTIYLMEKLNLERIDKNDDSISFKFKSKFILLGQNIIYMIDKNKYISNAKIRYINNITGNWFYTEEEAL